MRLLTLRVFSLQFYSQPVFIPSHFKNLLDLSKLLEKFTYTLLKQLVILFCKFSDFKKPYKCMASEWNSLLLRAIVFEFYSKLYIRPFFCFFSASHKNGFATICLNMKIVGSFSFMILLDYFAQYMFIDMLSFGYYGSF